MSVRPLVHCITNEVTSGRVADALAAIGALPVMASAPDEVEAIVGSADALLLNCGTPTDARWEAMRRAARVAARRQIPVVLDPVGAGASPWRAMAARELMAIVSPIVRGNAPEVAALAGITALGEERGVTAVGVPAARIEEVAVAASRALGTVVLVNGPIDAVAEGERLWSERPTPAPFGSVGLGDIVGALIAAVACSERDRFVAAWRAREIVAAATKRAAVTAAGPGSFWPAFIDALGARS